MDILTSQGDRTCCECSQTITTPEITLELDTRWWPAPKGGYPDYDIVEGEMCIDLNWTDQRIRHRKCPDGAKTVNGEEYDIDNRGATLTELHIHEVPYTVRVNPIEIFINMLSNLKPSYQVNALIEYVMGELDDMGV